MWPMEVRNSVGDFQWPGRANTRKQAACVRVVSGKFDSHGVLHAMHFARPRRHLGTYCKRRNESLLIEDMYMVSI
jgi:hypothetical protein